MFSPQSLPIPTLERLLALSSYRGTLQTVCDTGTTKGPSGRDFGLLQLQICKLPLSYVHYYYKPFFALLFPTGSFSHPPPVLLPSGTPTTCLPSSSYSPPYSILFQKLFGVLVYACVCLCVGLLPALRVLISSAI